MFGPSKTRLLPQKVREWRSVKLMRLVWNSTEALPGRVICPNVCVRSRILVELPQGVRRTVIRNR